MLSLKKQRDTKPLVLHKGRDRIIIQRTLSEFISIVNGNSKSFTGLIKSTICIISILDYVLK